MYSQFDAKIDILPWLYATGATTIFFYPYYDKLSFFPFFALFGSVTASPVRCQEKV